MEHRTSLRVLAIYRGEISENRGTPIRVRAILERLAKDGRFSVTVASWDTALPFSARHIRLENKKLKDAKALLAAAKTADIVIGHTMSAWYFLLLLKLVRGSRIVLEMHGFLEEEARLYGDIQLPAYYVSKLVYGFFYRMCDIITTCSENAAEILKHYNPHVLPLYGGVDTELFNPSVPAGDFFTRNEGDIVIGYAGNVRKWQGVPFLLEAFRKLRTEDKRFRLVMLSSEGKNIPEGEGITVVESVPHEAVPSFLASCDVLVIPRIEDRVSRISFPSKLPEYLAMGKPVVASATSDAHRVITDKVDGFVFPPGDVDAFLLKLEALSDPDLRRRIGEAARRTALGNFSWDTQVGILAERILSAS